MLIFCLILSSLDSCKKITIDTPHYAVGEVDVYFPNVNTSARIQFHYSYGVYIYNVAYSDREYGWRIPGSAGYNKGDRFMIQVNPNDFNQARMLFDYPVIDSSDFIKDTAYFATNKP